MLNARDVSEIRKNIEPKCCAIKRMAGVYVNSEKEKLLYINEPFLSLDESVFYKYLGLAKDVFGKRIGDNMLSVPFGEQQDSKKLLTGIVDGGLRQDESLDLLYDRIIEHYSYPGNYLILLWWDSYDVPKAASDRILMDESEEVYEYIICAICPVTLAAAGLSYHTEKHVFDNRVRDWVVQKPACGFVYPAFEERTTEADKVMFFNAKPAEPEHELMELGLQTVPTKTISEIVSAFNKIMIRAFDGTQEATELSTLIFRQLYLLTMDDPDMILTAAGLEKACMDAGLGEYIAELVSKEYGEVLGYCEVKAEWLLSKGMIAKIEAFKEEQEWKRKCKEAAKTIENMAGVETQLSKELRELAARK